METKKTHPGVYVPPPVIYALIFLFSLLLQKLFPISAVFFKTQIAAVLGYLFVALSIVFSLPAIVKFIRSKNTLITIKPANSLQTGGVYAVTRNPMYLGLLLLYTGIAFFGGNWWTFILIPLVVLIITTYVIGREEKYLSDAFGQDYTSYKIKVRRWI
ncbi:isoprenylcysteine carboxylmethyltransferase family protein [Mucilaginibacter sp. BT774]|uniref:methyltransferase family protein n=1 Tax=Mucilaginibacter sp. BT774 TaxID=3062276 RepID=UPI002675D546|nr:isoprenylcysteine carboxylmethyltransferase family protein [Mucilaginibacter sp. BT774]MDO3627406.1 isoprenylcysteine carboxylmethyltransferase family protein [Mucilaginibacter sp. BT774]